VRRYIYIMLAGGCLLACAADGPQQQGRALPGEAVPGQMLAEPAAGGQTAPNRDFMIQPQSLDVDEVMEGEEAHARLYVRNTGFLPLHIARVESACGCTVSALGSHEVPPGGFTTLDVTIDTTAKGDSVEKTVSVVDALGRRAEAVLHLRVRENPHAGDMGGKGIFSGKCAACHVEPVQGETTGAAIYAAACAMCHGTDAAGAYAPALRGMDAGAVSLILEHGISRRMPAFARAKGGPLTPAQVSELSAWLSGLDERR